MKTFLHAHRLGWRLTPVRLPGLVLMLASLFAISGYATAATDYLQAWQSLVDQNRMASIEQKLVAVNAFFNQMRSQSDKQLWQQNDYWALPQELLELGAGDCEDFALVKYHTLRELGIPEERLRLLNGRLYNLNSTGIEAHMVLAYVPDNGELLLLDNVQKGIKPLSARHDFVPKLAFNRQGVWRYANAAWVHTNDSAGYTKWSDYLVRLSQTGAGRVATAGIVAVDG